MGGVRCEHGRNARIMCDDGAQKAIVGVVSYFEPSVADADRDEAGGDELVATVKAMRLHKQCRNGTWSSSVKLLVADELGSECCVYDPSDAAEQRFELVAVGDVVEVSGRRQASPGLSIGGSVVPDSGFDSRTVLVADSIERAEKTRLRAREQAKAAAAAADAMREAMEEFLAAGGNPSEVQEAVAEVLAGRRGVRLR